ncbi:uncharacterized protein LTHEOB_4096 [Lasiodiplodia theobromae]|uniref:uncharacterized protein n=1 Tax=Lasiodiplodia theobromae TaxID=45133 RepID=UPI0015C38DD3|nr:uncharacterized protein LTHEOB_4096 [Lasiodiplodia theobromae]KAF4546788.1 hypothetical protein LTHEOB_4096 [Lasiodiplodia theobromae]
MDSGSSLGVRTRSSTKESERRRATVTPDGASSTASSGSTDVASTTTTSDDSGSSTPPARPVIRSNITASSSYRDYENRVDPLSPATRAACTRTWPDSFNMPSGLTPMQQRAFMQADLATYNAELAARKATQDGALAGNLSYLRTRLQPPSTTPDAAYDADDEAGDDDNNNNNNNLGIWGHDFEPIRPQRSLLTAVDPRQAFVNAVETVIPAIDVAHPPSMEELFRDMSPWEREVRVEAHREAMRRRHRAQMGERRYARAAAAGVRAEETAYEEENLAMEATRGFGGLAFERPEVPEESSESEEEEGECEVEVVREVVVISDDDDEDDGEEEEDDEEDNDEEMEDYDDDDFEEDGDDSKKRIKLESASPSPPAKRLKRSPTGQSQSSPKMPKVLGVDLDDDLLMMKGESDEDD